MTAIRDSIAALPFWAALLIALGIAELFGFAFLAFVGYRARRLRSRLLDGRDFDSLDDEERTDLGEEVNRTIMTAPIQALLLLYTAYHLPGLASWGQLTGESETMGWAQT
jgi:hypothetical protein